MKITDPRVDEWLLKVLPPRDAVLVEMEEKARARSIPIVGPAVARVLHQYARLVSAKRIFEMGSAIGYSTIWLARALPEGGKIWYTDGDEKNANEARGYFERAGVASKIEVIVGDAVDAIDQVPGQFDLIFNDVDKHQYPAAFEKAIPRLRSGGLFITDNALWSGRVTGPDQDEDTLGVKELDRLCYASDELFTTILPIRDGLAVCLKR